VIAASLAVFAAVVFIGFRDDAEEVGVAASSPDQPQTPIASPPAAPMPPPDPAISVLGTDSSTSEIEHALVLVSVVLDSKPRLARIGTDPRNPQTYAAGARLANGALLREVHAGYVVLERDGKESLLTIEDGDVRIAKKHRDIGTDASVLTVGGEDVVNAPIERVASSREDLSKVLRAEPFFERDEYAGLKILPGINGGRLAQLELQSGDIVRTIDGKRAKSADAAWQKLDDAISTGTPIVVGIEREGTMLSISLDGSRLNDSTPNHPIPMPGI
jgi:type II secretory pathway component PulC